MDIGSFIRISKAAGKWSWPLTSFYCRGQEWWRYFSGPQYVFWHNDSLSKDRNNHIDKYTNNSTKSLTTCIITARMEICVAWIFLRPYIQQSHWNNLRAARNIPHLNSAAAGQNKY
jgi:hypothetical protein